MVRTASVTGKRVAVLLHERQSEERLALYAISHLAELWRARGLDVVYLFGVGTFVPADLVIVHVDLSVVPDEYLEFARRYPVALNASVKDIRKSTFSTLMVSGDSDYDGPVIVKSDLNYAGVPERVLDAAPAGELHFQEPLDYQLYDSVAEVPPDLFHDERLVVERFLPERDNGHYHVRALEFLGDRHTSVRLTSTHHVVGTDSHVRWEAVEPPPRLFEIRRALGLDYGKLDYVLHGSDVTLLDVNKTMGATAAPSDTRIHDLRRTRAAGIYAYLG